MKLLNIINKLLKCTRVIVTVRSGKKGFSVYYQFLKIVIIRVDSVQKWVDSFRWTTVFSFLTHYLFLLPFITHFHKQIHDLLHVSYCYVQVIFGRWIRPIVMWLMLPLRVLLRGKFCIILFMHYCIIEYNNYNNYIYI